MSITLTVSVYQRRVDGVLTWSTVGLGICNCSHSGGSRVKLQRKLVEDLRRQLRDATPADMDKFRVHRGTRLERCALDLGVRTDDGRARFSGTVPLVCQPRWVTETEQVTVAFHPLHEDKWFAVRDGEDLADAATQYLRHAWAGHPESWLQKQHTDGKDQLRSISFSADPPKLQMPVEETGTRLRRSREPVLARIGADQTARAIEGTLPVGMPRRPYRDQLALLMCGPNKRPALVVGPPGVGKTTILNRWVADLVEDDGFAVHRNLAKLHRVWRVSGKRIIAGMSYLGDWERRCLDLISECKISRAVLWVEDLHLFGRLGQTRQSDRNMAEFFRGPVARGELRMVGECTPEQLSRLEDDAPAFASLFTTVRVNATTAGETLQMLVHEARDLEKRLPVEVHPFTHRAILEMSAGVYPWSSLPGKALDMLRQLGSRATAAGDDRALLVPSDVVSMLSAQTGLPENLLTLDARLEPAAVRQAIERSIIGQPDAVTAACDLIARVRAGLTDPHRPLAVYLFTGPTGTGKTELAKVIAEYLYGDVARMLRLDMSELASPDAVARLIGDRWQPEGQLTQRIREQPFSVVLLDEIEKAHPSVLYLLLQLFDEGRLTDAAGNTASFQNAVVIMTSNLGARPTRPVGFGDETRGMMADVARAVREFFPPELFNRIDRVVPFRPLSPAAAEAIATKELATLLNRRGLIDRHIFAYANQAVKKRIVDEAFDPRLGARTVKRYLEDRVGSLLTEQITAGQRAHMEVYRIYDAGDRLALYVDALAEATPADADFHLEGLLDTPTRQLLPVAKSALERIGRALDEGAIRRAIERARASERADELHYFIDELRDHTTNLRKALARLASGSRTLPDDPAPLELIADVDFVLGSLPRLADPSAHGVWVELARIGQAGAASDRSRFGDSAAGLIDWLATAYASARPAWLDGFACLLAGGKIRWRTGDDSASALADALAERPSRVALRLTGLFARDFFAGEPGSHIWQPSSAEPEIVRVDVSSDQLDQSPRERVQARVDAGAAFEAALEAGKEPLPDNPLALVPAVRSLRFRPPLRDGEVFGVEVEDFRTGTAGHHQVTSLSAVIDRMMLCWRGRQEVGHG